MAAKEIYDFVSIATPDYDAILSVRPQEILVETAGKNQVVHIMDDGSEERISLSDTSIFHIRLRWNYLTEADAGTIFDWWNDSTKANGIERTFKWSHPTDGHTYVVRFDSDISRAIRPANVHGFAEVRLKVLGKIAD